MKLLKRMEQVFYFMLIWKTSQVPTCFSCLCLMSGLRTGFTVSC